MHRFLLLFSCFLGMQAAAQINPQRITIARDSFGVPHIFAPTDPEVAYGLAWAHAEDDFADIQLVMLSGKGLLGSALGKKGAQADFVFQLLGCRDVVDAQWDSLAPDFVRLIEGYVAGINAYAKAHPDEVKYKHLLPFNEREYLAAVVFSLSVFSGADGVLPPILNGQVATIPGFQPQGSNAFAFHPSRTNTGEAFLVINAHQPVEGPTAFYEAHLNSEEGWNMLGGVFPGGCLIFHGTNENLGWAHTVNYMDKIDVFQLQINKDHPLQYRFDSTWLSLDVKKIKLRVKGIPFRIGKKIYRSAYGPTLRTKKGTFSIRLGANMDIRALQEWYRMNKARNFTEFYNALRMTSLPMFNIMYADRYDTIFYISNGKIPYRNPDPKYHWRSTVPGNTSATLWTRFKPVEALPQYINPGSGYLFNTNHSPFLATDSAWNLDRRKYDPNDGFELGHNNRSKRVSELVSSMDTFDYGSVKRIKFDTRLPRQLQYPYGIDTLLSLEPADWPAYRNVLQALQQWDRNAVPESRGAAVFLLLYYWVDNQLKGQPPRQLTKEESLAACHYLTDYLVRYFGTTEVSLGQVEKLVRGDVAEPADGIPDVLRAAYSVPYHDGMRRVNSGDAYICFVRYSKNSLPRIESINTFGASSHPDSPHYRDQETMFRNHRLKRMTLDKEEILRTAERTYHPMR